MKLPATLVHLAAATAVDSTDWEWTWNRSDKMELYCSLDGTKLVLAVSKKTNGCRPSNSRRVAKGKRIFSKFTDFEAGETWIAEMPDTLKRCGTALSITYDSDKWDGKKRLYIHDFKCAPNLYCDNPRNPRVMLISSPRLKITSRGIEG